METQAAGRHVPTEDGVREGVEWVEAAAGIRVRRFDATPSRQACRCCVYNQICPFTATRE